MAKRGEEQKGENVRATTHYLLPTTYYLLPRPLLHLPTTYYLLLITYYLLPTTYYHLLLPTTTYYYLLLPTTTYYYLLLPATATTIGPRCLGFQYLFLVCHVILSSAVRSIFAKQHANHAMLFWIIYFKAESCRGKA